MTKVRKTAKVRITATPLSRTFLYPRRTAWARFFPLDCPVLKTRFFPPYLPALVTPVSATVTSVTARVNAGAELSLLPAGMCTLGVQGGWCTRGVVGQGSTGWCRREHYPAQSTLPPPREDYPAQSTPPYRFFRKDEKERECHFCQKDEKEQE